MLPLTATIPLLLANLAPPPLRRHFPPFFPPSLVAPPGFPAMTRVAVLVLPAGQIGDKIASREKYDLTLQLADILRSE
jgi:hypothetical protein